MWKKLQQPLCGKNGKVVIVVWECAKEYLIFFFFFDWAKEYSLNTNKEGKCITQ